MRIVSAQCHNCYVCNFDGGKIMTLKPDKNIMCPVCGTQCEALIQHCKQCGWHFELFLSQPTQEQQDSYQQRLERHRTFWNLSTKQTKHAVANKNTIIVEPNIIQDHGSDVIINHRQNEQKRDPSSDVFDKSSHPTKPSVEKEHIAQEDSIKNKQPLGEKHREVLFLKVFYFAMFSLLGLGLLFLEPLHIIYIAAVCFIAILILLIISILGHFGLYDNDDLELTPSVSVFLFIWLWAQVNYYEAVFNLNWINSSDVFTAKTICIYYVSFAISLLLTKLFNPYGNSEEHQYISFTYPATIGYLLVLTFVLLFSIYRVWELWPSIGLMTVLTGIIAHCLQFALPIFIQRKL